MSVLNQKRLNKYIREQEADDRIRDSISTQDYVDPFNRVGCERLVVI